MFEQVIEPGGECCKDEHSDNEPEQIDDYGNHGLRRFASGTRSSWSAIRTSARSRSRPRSSTIESDHAAGLRIKHVSPTCNGEPTCCGCGGRLADGGLYCEKHDERRSIAHQPSCFVVRLGAVADSASVPARQTSDAASAFDDRDVRRRVSVFRRSFDFRHPSRRRYPRRRRCSCAVLLQTRQWH